MRNVIPFNRKHGKSDDEHAARHRRDGFFDDQDNWHDAESESAAATDGVAR